MDSPGATSVSDKLAPSKLGPVPPRRRTPGIPPAMIVIALALVILGIFAVGAAVTSGHRQQLALSPRTAPFAVKGSSLAAVPATGLLRSIEITGAPPVNVVRALDVPAGTRLVTAGRAGPPRIPSGSSGLYDEQVVMATGASQGDVIGFFRAVLPTKGWDVFSTGPAVHHPRTIEVLSKIAGGDGWFWEVGVLVSPTTFAASSPGSAAPSTRAGTGDLQTTRFSLRLFQVSDEQ